MTHAVTTETSFVDRRSTPASAAQDRRQFSNSHDELQPEVRELAQAIDEYKLRHRRRFISYDEIYQVVRELGYSKD